MGEIIPIGEVDWIQGLASILGCELGILLSAHLGLSRGERFKKNIFEVIDLTHQ